METIRTNALEYEPNTIDYKLKGHFIDKILLLMHRLRRRYSKIDDFDWRRYGILYGAQQDKNRKFYTMDISKVGFRVVNGKIYTIADSKPIHLTVRCVWEAILNLPQFTSVLEIGTGDGHFIVGLKHLIGDSASFSATDLSESQLRLFEISFPKAFVDIQPDVLDITKNSVEHEKRADVVFASTVLMHIQRPDAYQNGLRNLLLSGSRFVVLMDNWNSHDYFGDLTQLIGHNVQFKDAKLYTYDSSANIAIIVTKEGEILNYPYKPLCNKEILTKYLP